MSEKYTPEIVITETAITEMRTIKQLRWQCRRGMLELDIILSRFLEKRYEQLSPAEQIQFVQLLSATDPELYSWLVTKATVPPSDLEFIVNAIRLPILAQN